MNIFIAKLSGRTTSEDLQEAFEQYGEVTSAKVIMDRETGRSKCFGFVEMANDEEARSAIEALDNAQFHESTIVVKEARPREERAPRSFGGGGGGGGFRPRSPQGPRSGGGGGFRPREDRGGYGGRNYSSDRY